MNGENPNTSLPQGQAVVASLGRQLTDEQVHRWAELIADGRDEFPADLSPPDSDRLLTEVRRRLRDRLIRLVARAIAAQLHRRSKHGREGKSDD